MNEIKLLNIGSLNIDNFYTVDSFVAPGETKQVKSLRVSCGGKGLNQSLAAARAGLCVRHLGQVGSNGEFLVQELNKSGVDTQHVCVIDGESGHTVIQVNEAGQNCILVYGGANRNLKLDDIVSALGELGSDDVILLQNETNLVRETLELAAKRGVRVAFNPSPLSADLLSYPLDCVKWLFVNEIEGAALTHQEDSDQILSSLHRKFPKMDVILTLGEQGSIWMHDGVREQREACKVKAVDTTAAGDTFTGYFLRGVLNPIAEINPLDLATVASALAVCSPGAAVSIPMLDEVTASSLLA